MSHHPHKAWPGSRRPVWTSLVVCCILLELCGCSLFVMGLKMVQGDPKVGDKFKAWYGKSLAQTDKYVAILCTTPESIKAEDSSLDVELLSEVSRRLAVQDVKIVKPHKVSSWIDEHGGGNLDLEKLGEAVGADFIIHIRLDTFSFLEHNSPQLFRGRAHGMVVVYEMKRSKTEKIAEKTAKSATDRSKGDEPTGKVIGMREVFVENFESTYPVHQPVSVEQMQLEMFRKKYIDRVSNELAWLFYAHRVGTDF